MVDISFFYVKRVIFVYCGCWSKYVLLIFCMLLVTVVVTTVMMWLITDCIF